jgi:hypothetical protein
LPPGGGTAAAGFSAAARAASRRRSPPNQSSGNCAGQDGRTRLKNVGRFAAERTLLMARLMGRKTPGGRFNYPRYCATVFNGRKILFSGAHSMSQSVAATDVSAVDYAPKAIENAYATKDFWLFA